MQCHHNRLHELIHVILSILLQVNSGLHYAVLVMDPLLASVVNIIPCAYQVFIFCMCRIAVGSLLYRSVYWGVGIYISTLSTNQLCHNIIGLSIYTVLHTNQPLPSAQLCNPMAIMSRFSHHGIKLILLKWQCKGHGR